MQTIRHSYLRRASAVALAALLYLVVIPGRASLGAADLASDLLPKITGAKPWYETIRLAARGIGKKALEDSQNLKDAPYRKYDLEAFLPKV